PWPREGAPEGTDVSRRHDNSNDAQGTDAQSAAQPSPAVVLPSSQASPPSQMPSPQRGTVQFARHVVEVERAWISVSRVISKATKKLDAFTQRQVVMPPPNVGCTRTVQSPGIGRPWM